MDQSWKGFGSALASLLFLWAMLSDYFPVDYAAKLARRLAAFFCPYIQITIPEHTGAYMRRSEAYTAVESYLKASSSQSANKLTATFVDTTNILLTMDADEQVSDHFRGANLWWSSHKTIPRTQIISFYATPQERRSFKLIFHKRHRSLVISDYLPYIMAEGHEVALRSRQRKLFTNNPINDGDGEWSHIKFEHPASFDTLAMDPTKKRDIIADLDTFREGKEYYARIGKTWKRGYLLYGPPGTGKSTMIAAMADYMDYDIYDIELTIVKNNTELRKLLIETTSKSIIVLEDIDCSLDLTNKRSEKKPETEEKSKEKPKEKEESSKVTLSGLLNFIDGLWSACGSERLIVFTTNYIEMRLVGVLAEVERFYDCIGGIIGYQIMVLDLILPSNADKQIGSWTPHLYGTGNLIVELHVPSGLDLHENIECASQAALWGIEGLPELGEIYPLGGSGDRLGLVDSETGKCLPAALLPYCGRTLLEGLIRDLQAREFLYFKIYGKQCITPVAIMTSSVKNNHSHITALCERFGWFGRGRDNFRLFEQPLVPVVSAPDGQWLTSGPLSLVCKPGGHGAIWKLAHDKGIFQWFYCHGRKGATVRQVSNVVAATDVTLLALAGLGLQHKKKLGFASCQRNVGATEGINVLIEKRDLEGNWEYGITCIEYTEFEKYGIRDAPSLGSLHSGFPANTNILYVDLPSAEKIGSSQNATCLPGMVLNLKKPVSYVDHQGFEHSVSGGRLECTMQNIADNFMNSYTSRCNKDIEGTLDTFIVHNERKRVTSSAKRKRKKTDSSLHQTPDGSLLDVIRNASDVLSYCNIEIPKIGDNSTYLDSAPPFLIFLHPALGPLWEVTRQKFSGGSISEGSELQIEVAEFLWRDVKLEGSLVVIADNIMGSIKMNKNSEPTLLYGQRCGRCRLQNVKVLNRGIDWSCVNNVYWKHDVNRFEMLKIVLHGNAEFEASDVTLQGNHVFEVPDGYRMRIISDSQDFTVKLDPIAEGNMDSGSWFWKYKLKGTHINLEMVEM